jgi:hypothetical protein
MQIFHLLTYVHKNFVHSFLQIWKVRWIEYWFARA